MSKFNDIPGVITESNIDLAVLKAQTIGNKYGKVILAPLGTGADDWVRLFAVLDVCAGKYPVELINGTWRCQSVQEIPSYTHLIGNSGVISKRIDSPYVGSQNLRVAYGGSTSPCAQQAYWTIGGSYRLIGNARGDGTKTPMIYDGAVKLWEGTNSTTWQSFDVSFQSAGTTLQLYCNTSSDGYAEFDNITVTNISTSAFIDQSPIKTNSVQATATKQPTYIVSGVNGQPIFRFDGTSDFLSSAFALDQPETIFIIVKVYSGATSGYICDGSNSDRCSLYYYNSNLYQYATSQGAVKALPRDAWHIVESVFNGANSTLTVDNGTPSTGNPGTASSNGIALGSMFNGAANCMNGDIAKVIIFKSTVEAFTRSRLSLLLMRRYGLGN